jgi:hypothetical protein
LGVTQFSIDDRVVVLQPHLDIRRRIRRDVIRAMHPAEIILPPILRVESMRKNSRQKTEPDVRRNPPEQTNSIHR